MNQTTEVAIKQTQGLASMMDDQFRVQLARTLSSDRKEADRYLQVAMGTIRRSKQLLDIANRNPLSILSAIGQSAQVGLDIDVRGLAYLVPYKNECQFQLGYKGMLELLYRSGVVKDVAANVVYEEEYKAGNFHYSDGTNRVIKHDIDLLHPELREGKIVAAYAVFNLHGGGRVFRVVDKAFLDKRQNASPSGQSKYSPWHNWYEEMAMKTAIRAAIKLVPQSVDDRKAQQSLNRLAEAEKIEAQYESVVVARKAEENKRVSELNNALLGAEDVPAQERQPEKTAEKQPLPRNERGGWNGIGLDPDGIPIMFDEESEFIAWAKQKPKSVLAELATALALDIDNALDKPRYTAAMADSLYNS